MLGFLSKHRGMALFKTTHEGRGVRGNCFKLFNINHVRSCDVRKITNTQQHP